MDKKVFIVDDHPVVAQGIKRFVEQEEGFTVIGLAEGKEDALVAVANNMPDAITIDLSLNGESGFELISELRKTYPKLAILVLSMYDEEEYAERTLQAGANGYVMKQERPEIVIDALKTIMEGKRYVSDNVKELFVQRMSDGYEPGKNSDMDKLTQQELRVYHLYGRGRSTTEIGDTMAEYFQKKRICQSERMLH